MKYFYSILLSVSFLSDLSGTSVRVLLSESTTPNWKLEGGRGFFFQDPKNGKRFYLNGTYKQLIITKKNNQLCVNGKPFLQDTFYIKPIKKPVSFFEGTYDGFFMVVKHKGKYLLINVIETEEYVFSVLKAESWPGWPLEVNKVFAVASRSYVLHQLLKARKQGLPYHIRNTNHHQCYNGTHSCQVTRKAIEETRGLFLAHKGEPILAMFDICCGGVVPCHVTGIVDFAKAPYLARKYACTFCRDCKSFSWEVEYSLDQLKGHLQEGLQELLHDIKDIKVARKDKAGVVQDILAKTVRTEISFSVHEIYRLLKEVKSFSFSIKRKAKRVMLKGKGFGHHIGLCQWGAREMVRQGWSFESILQFFYPGTHFMRLA